MRALGPAHRCATCGKPLRPGDRRPFEPFTYCSLACFRTWIHLSGKEREHRLARPPVPPSPGAAPPVSAGDDLGSRIRPRVRKALAAVAVLTVAAAVCLLFALVGQAPDPPSTPGPAPAATGFPEASREARRTPEEPPAPGPPRADTPRTAPPVPGGTIPEPPAAAASREGKPSPAEADPGQSPRPLDEKTASLPEPDDLPVPPGHIVETMENGAPEDNGIHGMVRGRRDVSEISLTFDGSWDNRGVDPILAALTSRQVQATFFLSGPFLRAHPDTVRRIVHAGHEVGNHLWDHIHLTTFSRNRRHDLVPGMTRERFHRLLTENERSFHRITGARMAKLWRAPYGETNPTLERWAGELGYIHVSWTNDPGRGRSMDTLDWVSNPASRRYLSANQIRDRIVGFDLGRQGGANGAIILMHVGSQRRGDYPWEQLNDVIDRMREKGYTFVPAGRLASEFLTRTPATPSGLPSP